MAKGLDDHFHALSQVCLLFELSLKLFRASPLKAQSETELFGLCKRPIFIKAGTPQQEAQHFLITNWLSPLASCTLTAFDCLVRLS